MHNTPYYRGETQRLSGLLREIREVIRPYEKALGLDEGWNILDGVKALVTAAQHYMNYQRAFAEGRVIDPDLTDLLAVIERLRIGASAHGLEGEAETRQRQADKLRALIAAVYQDGPGLEEWGLRMKLDLSREEEARLSESAWEKLAQIIEGDLEPESGPAIDVKDITRPMLLEWARDADRALQHRDAGTAALIHQQILAAIIGGALDNVR